MCSSDLRKIKQMTASKSRIVLVPYEQATGEGFEDMRRRMPDTGKLQRLLHWQPQLTLEQTLTDMIAQARAEGPIDTLSQRAAPGAVVVG